MTKEDKCSWVCFESKLMCDSFEQDIVVAWLERKWCRIVKIIPWLAERQVPWSHYEREDHRWSHHHHHVDNCHCHWYHSVVDFEPMLGMKHRPEEKLARIHEPGYLLFYWSRAGRATLGGRMEWLAISKLSRKRVVNVIEGGCAWEERWAAKSKNKANKSWM